MSKPEIDRLIDLLRDARATAAETSVEADLARAAAENASHEVHLAEQAIRKWVHDQSTPQGLSR